MGFDPIERVFQIALSDPEDEPPVISAALEKNIRSIRRVYPKAAYQLVDGRAARVFLAAHFEPAVLSCYEHIVPMAYRADLLRYCLLYVHGGLYSDLSHYHLRPIRVPERAEMLLFRDISHHPDHAVSNGLMYSKPGSAVMFEAIQRILAHAKARFYGDTPLDPTGPYLLGRVVQEIGGSGISMGHSRPCRPGWLARWVRKQHQVHVQKITTDQRVVAEKRKAGNADVAEFLGEGGNDYNDLWLRRRVWGEGDGTGEGA